MSNSQAATASASQSHDPAVPVRRLLDQTDLRFAVAAETERPQLAAGHSVVHAADVVVLKVDQANGAKVAGSRSSSSDSLDGQVTSPPPIHRCSRETALSVSIDRFAAICTGVAPWIASDRTREPAPVVVNARARSRCATRTIRPISACSATRPQVDLQWTPQ